MENKSDKNYKPIVFIGPCSSGKSTLSKSIYGNHNCISTDALISYLGLGNSVHYKDLFEELEFYVENQQYKVFDIGGATISCMPPEFQASFKEIFKNATIVEIKPHPNNKISFNFLKKMIMSEKRTSKSRKKELVESLKYDLNSQFIAHIKTVPTIYTLKEINTGKKLLFPLIPGEKLRYLYLKGLNNIHPKVAEKISNENDTISEFNM